MKRRLAIAAVLATTFCVAFWFYGAARTMREAVGWDAQVALCCLLLTTGMLTLFALPWFLILYLVNSSHSLCSRFAVSAMLATLLVGSVVSELHLLRDEMQFAHEVEGIDQAQIYARNRAWPIELCSLVYVPGQGIHSTD